jgi:3-deoxy-manno-octulosonate cytidylyltransferase (CMP-KDO synthetase)
MATIIAVNTDAMILFHSKDDIGVLSVSPCGRRHHRTVARAAENRIPRSNSTELLRFRQACEAGILSPLGSSDDCTVSALPTNSIILIPTRLAAARLPNKPLADIAGTPMILHVWRRAVAAEIGPVVVASGDEAIAEVVERAGGRAVMTDPDLPTGSDRIHAAIGMLDPVRAHDAVINVQGDMPMIEPAAIRLAVAALGDPETDIATLAAEITDPAALHDTSVNKVAAGFADPKRPVRALYFSKAPVPWGDGPHYEHVGLYAYRRAALDRFVSLPRGVLERRERLEQLRALEAGMTISVSLIEPDQLGVQVDTPADLDRARIQMMQRGFR